MSVDIRELKDRITSQAFTLKKAKTRGMMVTQETDRMRNILMNSLDEIVEALEYAVNAEERMQRLVVEVESADEELAEKDKEIAELKAAKAKGKKPNVEQGVQ